MQLKSYIDFLMHRIVECQILESRFKNSFIYSEEDRQIGIAECKASKKAYEDALHSLPHTSEILKIKKELAECN